jgi:hypothetical protein
MAFIRKKGQYAYLVESHRDESGKPRQKVLAYLGLITEMDAKLYELRREHPEWFTEPSIIPTTRPGIAAATDYSSSFSCLMRSSISCRSFSSWRRLY